MIDRHKVIKRHNPSYNELKKRAPLSVGNGVFCFTADFTGLQTFYDEYSASSDAFPLCTMAEWGWHSYPLPEEEKKLLRLTPYDTNGRIVNYACDNTGQEELFKKIRVNAHKFHLGKISFKLKDKDLAINDCKPVNQTLFLWEGILESEFLIEEEIVKTQVFIHPNNDTLYIKAVSPLLENGKLQINITFPYGSHKKTAADFSAAHLHSTRLNECRSSSICVERELDKTNYFVIVNGDGFSSFLDDKQHVINIVPNKISIDF